MNGDLFWYPAIHGLNCPDEFDKGAMLDSYVRYFLARLQSMFKYDGLPDTIPAKWLEAYLMCNGNALIGKANDGQLYAFTGGHGGQPNAYYIPTQYIVANPYLKLTKTFNIYDGLNPDGDGVLIYNDTFSQGLIPMLQRYCMQLVENDITMQLADVLARATVNISAADDRTKKSAQLWLNHLKEGKLGIIAENPFIEGLNIREFHYVAETLTNLIEYHQYIKASLYNELGLNSNYNMKRESINSNESQLNDDMLHPLIDDMLRERREGIARVNELFGLNITVDFDNAWLENEREELITIDKMEAEAEVVEAQAEAMENEEQNNEADSDIDNVVDNDPDGENDSQADIEETTAEEVAEETTEEVIEEAQDKTPEETPTQIVDALEELTEAVEQVAEILEDDTRIYERGSNNEEDN